MFFALTASASAQISDALNRNPIANKTAPDRTTIRLCTPSRSSAMVKPPLWIVNEVVVKASLFREYIRPLGHSIDDSFKRFGYDKTVWKTGRKWRSKD